MTPPTRHRVVYLDSSALVKLVVAERESAALIRFLRRRPVRISCALARTEVVRAVRHLGPDAVTRAREMLRRIDLIAVDDALLDAAAVLDPRVTRSLDAIHLSAALTLSAHLGLLVTYDQRMAGAARLLGLTVSAPA